MMTVHIPPTGRQSVNSVDTTATADTVGFNYNELTLVITNNTDTALMAPQNGLSQTYGYYAAFYMTNNAVGGSLICQIDTIGANTIQTSYFDPTDLLLCTTRTNLQTGISNETYVYAGSTDTNAARQGVQTSRFKTVRMAGCGQAVANCITAAYTNNGWVSVWAFVQTAFIPETAVAIAAACAVRNC